MRPSGHLSACTVPYAGNIIITPPPHVMEVIRQSEPTNSPLSHGHRALPEPFFLHPYSSAFAIQRKITSLKPRSTLRTQHSLCEHIYPSLTTAADCGEEESNANPLFLPAGNSISDVLTSPIIPLCRRQILQRSQPLLIPSLTTHSISSSSTMIELLIPPYE